MKEQSFEPIGEFTYTEPDPLYGYTCSHCSRPSPRYLVLDSGDGAMYLCPACTEKVAEAGRMLAELDAVTP